MTIYDMENMTFFYMIKIR